ncbi:hypothetical protein PVAP13_3KG554432 [Panicum virgatum]|uniref:Post-SET domain-containing protein n=1 Tax=Panicum virgatum TaxID=38727 RepID=A0A8T0VGJ2_PANVG|nr:hypothetical protein PVAP13_3KG554432 [Panicum virgatum]
MSYGLPNEASLGCRRTECWILMSLHFETQFDLQSNKDMYMWNQVNCTKSYCANIKTSSPYNQWSYLMVSYPHQFINHSCQPNLFVPCLLSSHNNVKLAKVPLFAADTILPLQELSYDYGYRLDIVVGPDGEIVKMPCHCGAPDCRKRLY